MNNITIRNIEPQNIKISGAGEVIGITAVYVNGVNVTEGTVAYVIVPTKTSELVNNSGYITSETDPTVPYYVKNISISDISNWNNKQDELVSGVNIKTINSNSLLGSGNIDISASYSAGTGIEITEENVINNTITSYDDLDNLPTIPTKISDLTNDSDFVESSELAEVAFNGSYLALSNTPANTSDFTNDGEDGINPFITNQTDGLVNYFDKDFLFNMLPKVSDTDSIINLSPTVKNAPLYLTLGATALSQDGTPTPSSPQDIHTISGSNKVVVCGKNLGRATFDNKLYLTGSGDNRTVAERTSDLVGEIIKVKPSTSYTISGTFTDFGDSALRFGEFTNIPVVGATSTKHNSTSSSITFTTQSTTNYLLLYNTFARNTTAPNLFVCETQYADTYEPYTSQEADIDLDTTEYCKIGNYEDKFIRTSGKNLFEAEYIKQSQDTSINAHLKKETYTLSLEGKPNFGAIIYIQLYKNNTMITETGHILNTSSAVSFSTSSYWYYFQNVPNTNYLTFTLDDDYDVKIALYNAVGTQRAMLNKGSVALDYEPYGTNTWYIKKNIGKVVLDGSENWFSNATTENYTEFGCSNAFNPVAISGYDFPISNYFSNTVYNRTVSNGGAILIRVLISENIETKEQFQTWLSTHNTIVYYKLGTPTYTQITGTLAEQLETIYKDLTSETDQTNISQVNADLPFTISATTLKSLANL